MENEEEEEEEEDIDNEEDEDVQSFVTAHENENDHITASVNDLHLGHDDDGETYNIHILTRSICLGWITPSNFKIVKSKALDNGASDNSETIHETLPVACITTDFSMQVCVIIYY